MALVEVPEEVVLQLIQSIIPDAVFRGDEDGFLVIETGLMYTGWVGENLIGNVGVTEAAIAKLRGA